MEHEHNIHACMHNLQTYLGAPIVKAVEVHYKAVTPEAQANRCSDPPGVRSKQVPSSKAGPQGLGSEYLAIHMAPQRATGTLGGSWSLQQPLHTNTSAHAHEHHEEVDNLGPGPGVRALAAGAACMATAACRGGGTAELVSGQTRGTNKGTTSYNAT